MKELIPSFVTLHPHPEVVLQKFGLCPRGLWRGSAADTPYSDLSEAARFRHALEELGGLYAAFGQFLCWRADLLRTEYLGRLRHIKVHVAPVGRDEFTAVLSAELGEAGAALAGALEDEPCWNTLSRCAYRGQVQGKLVVAQLARDPIPDAAFEAFEAGIRLISEEKLQTALRPSALNHFREWMRLSDSPDRERSYLDTLQAVSRNSLTHYPVLIPELSAGRILTTEWIEASPLAPHIAQGSPQAVQRVAECVLEQICTISAIDAEFDPDSMALTPAGRLVVRRANRLVAIPAPLAHSCLKYIAAVLASNAPAAAQALAKLSSGRAAMELETRLLDELSNLEPELKVNLQFPLSAAVFEGNWRALNRAGAVNPLYVDMMHRSLIAVGYWNAETSAPPARPTDAIAEAQWPVLGRMLPIRLNQMMTHETASDWFIGSGLLFFETLRQMNRLAEGLRENDVALGVDVQGGNDTAKAHLRIRNGILVGMLVILFLASLRFAMSLEGFWAALLSVVAVASGLALFWFVSRFD